MAGQTAPEDEDSLELDRYVLDHGSSFLTDLERRVLRAIEAEAKAAHCSSERMASLLRDRWGGHSDEDVSRALADGPIACRRQIRDRLLRDHAARIEIRRCPECHRLLRTPRARQCFLCGFNERSSPPPLA